MTLHETANRQANIGIGPIPSAPGNSGLSEPSQYNPWIEPIKHTSADPYALCCAVLAPLVQSPPMNAIFQPDVIHNKAFAAFLYRHKLHALWSDLQQTIDPVTELNELLGAATRMSVAAQLPQQRLLEEARAALNRAGIPWFVAKGVHLQHTYYDQPAHRPATDIDLFVHARDRNAATQCLLAAGFVAEPLAETLSHELKLVKHTAAIDLHWHLLRPGRYRPGLMNWLFEHREKFGDCWGLDATASLLVMLTHPAITKYLISPTSMMIHQVDQVRLMRSGMVDWGSLYGALDQFGLKTSAWSSCYLLRKLTGIEMPENLEQRLQPGRIHAAWLQFWIDRAWITRWFDHRWLVAGLFNLALQDSVADAVRALKYRHVAQSV
jgi:hypothetical protein